MSIRWNDDTDPLWLLTPAEYDALPDGQIVIAIFGYEWVKGTDYIDGDIRGGHLAYGLRESAGGGRS